MKHDMQPLNLLELPLKNKVLIEASAGTGKTYSLAALYLRLVIGGANTAFEQGLAPEQLLVMTFTRAATQELRQRIRQRLAEAAAFFNNAQDTNDAFLIDLKQHLDVPPATAAERCRLAAQQMDKAAIYTIHGFCQRALQRFAFAASQPFEQTLETDPQKLVTQAWQDYWRRFIQPLPQALVDALEQEKILSHTALENKAKGVEGDTAPDDFPASITQCAPQFAQLAQARETARQLALAERQQLVDWFHAEADAGTLKQNPYGISKAGKDYLDALHAFLDSGKESPTLAKYGLSRLDVKKGKTVTPPANLVPCLQAFDDYADARDNAAFPINDLLAHAAQWTRRNVDEQLTSQAGMTFDSMITALSNALNAELSPLASTLANQLRNAYPCALIDEFQDTNRAQYGIFDAIYQDAETDRYAWLMIGDPKQSIYGFQGADIQAYIAAKESTAPDNRFTLDTNYRSSRAMIEATNALFGTTPVPADQLFGSALISFQPIRSPAQSSDLAFALNKAVQPAGVHLCYPNQEGPHGAGDAQKLLSDEFANRVVHLLNDASLGGQPVQPKDITLLVRKSSQAESLKNALAKRGVESVFLSEKNSVYDSHEAHDLLTLLNAIAQPGDSGRVRRALATRLLACTWQEQADMWADDIKQQALLRQLRHCQTRWEKSGPLPMLHWLVHQLDLPSRLAHRDSERSLTNLFHLAELLQKNAKTQDGIHAQLQAFEQALVDKPQGGEDNAELLIRLENERNRVQIMTLHKSKGLEFPLVLLPFVTLATDKPDEAEEEMRLLYVGITRAKHACHIGLLRTKHKTEKNGLDTSPLGRLLFGSDPAQSNSAEMIDARLDALLATANNAIALHREPVSATELRQEQTAPDALADSQALALPTRLPAPWRVTSYSGLVQHKGALQFTAEDERHDEISPSNPMIPPASIPHPDRLDYHTFPKGRHTGNLLHGLLEQCSVTGFKTALTSPDHLAQWIARATRADLWQGKQTFIGQWLQHIIATPLPFGAHHFALSAAHTTLAESEFWLQTSQVDVEALNQLTIRYLPGTGSRALTRQTLNGMVKGFIDLLIEHEGKYYVLDYKSNHLGQDDSAYHATALQQAVIANRYDLQGLIYQQALHRLLAARLPDYDPDQHLGGSAFFFLRGINHPDTHGLCFIPPDTGLLQQVEQLLGAEETTA